MSKNKKNRRNKQTSTPQKNESAAPVSSEPKTAQASSQPAPREVKHLNTRFLAGLLIVCAVSGLGLYFLHGFQVKRSADKIKIRSQSEAAKGETEKAIDLLGQYLKLKPEDTEALADLGMLVDGSPPSGRTFTRAYRIYSQVLRDNPEIENAPKIRYRLVQLMMNLGDFQSAETQISRLHKLLDDRKIGLEIAGPGDPEPPASPTEDLPFTRSDLFFKEGVCKLRQSQREQSLIYFLAAVGADQSKLEPYLAVLEIVKQLRNDLPSQDKLNNSLAKLPASSEFPERLEAVLSQFPKVVKVVPDKAETDADESPQDSTEEVAQTGDPFASENIEPASSTTKNEDSNQDDREDQPQIVSAKQINESLLEQMVNKVTPQYEAYLARASYHLMNVSSAKTPEEEMEVHEFAINDIMEAKRSAGNVPKVRLFDADYSLLKLYLPPIDETNDTPVQHATPLENVQHAIDITRAALEQYRGALGLDNLAVDGNRSTEQTSSEDTQTAHFEPLDLSAETPAEKFQSFISFSIKLSEAELRRFDLSTEDQAKLSALKEAELSLQSAIDTLSAAREATLQTEEKTDSKESAEAVDEDASKQADQKQPSELDPQQLNKRDLAIQQLNRYELALPQRMVELHLTAMGSPLLDEQLFDEHSNSVTAGISHLATLPDLNTRLALQSLLQYLKARWAFNHLSTNRTVSVPDTLNEDFQGGASWSDVRDLLEKARVNLSADQPTRRVIDLMLSDCYRQLKTPEERERLFRDVVTNTDRGWQLGRLEFARALEAVGKTDEAIREYSSLGSEAANVALLNIAIRQQLQLPVERRDWIRIQVALDEIRAANTNSFSLDLVQVELFVQQKNFDAAAELLASLRSRDDATLEQSLSAWAVSIRFALYREDELPDQQIALAKNYYDNAVNEFGPKAQLALANLSIALKASTEEFKQQVNQLRGSLEQYSKEDRVTILEKLATEFARLKDEKTQYEIIGQLVALLPENPAYHWALAEKAIDDQQEKTFEKHIREIRRIEGNSSAMANFLEARWIERMIRESDPNDSQQRDRGRDLYSKAMGKLRAAESERSRWIQVFLLRGDLAGSPLVADETTEYESYREAIELGSVNPNVYLRVINYLEKHGRYREADLLLSQLRQKQSQSYNQEVASKHSQILYEQRNFEEAFDTMRRSMADAEDYEKHLNEAFIKMLELRQIELRGSNSAQVQSHLQTIESEFEAAIETGAEHGRVWIGYVLFHKLRGNLEAAGDVIKRATEQLPNDSADLKPLVLGACYELIGETEKAQENYDRAFESQPDSPAVNRQLADFYNRSGDPAKEIFHLEKLESLEGAEFEALRRDVKNRLKISRVTAGNYRDAEIAIAELENDLPLEKESRFRNLATQTTILTRFSVRPFQLKLIAVLEELKKMEALPLTDQITLLSVYRQTNQLDRAVEEAKQLREENPEDQLILTLYTELCLQQQNYEEADKLLPLLEKTLPETGLVVSLQAQKEFDQSGKQAAVDRVLAYHQSIKPTRSSEQIFQETVSRANFNVAFRWLLDVPGIAGTIHARRVAEGLRYLNKRNLDEARRQLKPVLELPKAKQYDYAQRLRECVVLLSRFKALSEAEILCREYVAVSENPASVVLLISLIGRQGRVEETLQLCEKSIATAGASRVIPNAIALLRQHNHTAEHEKRVEQMIADNIQSNPNDLTALLQSADYQDYKQNYDAAEKLYLSVLSKNKNSPLALNNLAWLLAMHNPNTNRVKQARDLIDRAIDRVGPSAELMDSKATVELADERPDKALELLEQSIETSPTAAKYFHLAQAQFALDRETDAKSSLKKAIEMGLEDEYLHPLEIAALKQLKDKVVAGL